jgi:predicted metal-dependent peptidase
VSVIGTSGSVTIAGWYDDGASHHLEQFFSSTNKRLLDSKVDALVNAMAAFSPPAAGQLTLTGSMATSLQPVIASSWTPA